ncbi:MAG: cob(I)yrinic acid a,c-diamide adenosyltransferase [Gammaproteobacteria bacterium]|nr:MAG: cob(I)yrinic acid a,c-diamide adenosyltransferase [Gammaproteobacteria bacterium]
MGYRLSKIYTRTGDDGTTGLSDGSRVPKHSLRMEAIGTIDELNCQIGMLASVLGEHPHTALLYSIQNDLFDLGGELSMPGHCLLPDHKTLHLESMLDTINAALPPLENFILPGGPVAASQCHLARAVCRRAERTLSALHAEAGDVNTSASSYINRLSDLLFVMARAIARENGGQEVLWQQTGKTS